MKKQYQSIFLTAVFTMLLSSFAVSQSDVVPIMIMDNLPHTAILGGVKDNKFISADATVEEIGERQNYFMVDQEGIKKFDFAGEIKAAQPACSEYFETNITANFDHKGLGFGANADWNTAPQKIAELFNFGHYKPIVAKFLQAQGIKNPNVKIAQIFYGDLDGDGRSEDVISATNADDFENGGTIGRGDYSFVIVRKLIGGNVKTILLEGVFYPRGLTKNMSPAFYDVSAVADLNGDGKMEIVVGGFEYEKTFYKAFEINGGEKDQILEIECGI